MVLSTPAIFRINNVVEAHFVIIPRQGILLLNITRQFASLLKQRMQYLKHYQPIAYSAVPVLAKRLCHQTVIRFESSFSSGAEQFLFPSDTLEKISNAPLLRNGLPQTACWKDGHFALRRALQKMEGSASRELCIGMCVSTKSSSDHLGAAGL